MSLLLRDKQVNGTYFYMHRVSCAAALVATCRLFRRKAFHFSYLLILLTVFFPLSLLSCKKAIDEETLIFADINQLMLTPIYIAEENGYFNKENLTVEYREFSSGRDALKSVIAGETEIGAAAEFPFVQNILNGHELEIITTIHRTNENQGLVARIDSGIHAAEDLAGKRIGLALGTSSEYALSLLLNEVGLINDDVILHDISPESIDEALFDGSVDAIITWSPHIERALHQFTGDTALLLRIPIFTELSMVGGLSHVIDKKQEALYRFTRAVAKAEVFINDHPEESLEIAIRNLPEIPEEIIRNSWPKLHFQLRLDNLLIALLENEANWLISNNNLAADPPDFQKALAPQFLESSKPLSVTILPTNTHLTDEASGTRTHP